MENKNDLIIVREFNLPIEALWKYWADPVFFKQWWGPKDFTCPECKIDFKVGGKYLNAMQGPDGKKYWSTGVYKEIIPYKKIVVKDSFADEKGNVVPSSYYGMEGFPLETQVAVTFEKLDGKTKMTLIHSGIENIDEITLKNMTQGWNQSFDKII